MTITRACAPILRAMKLPRRCDVAAFSVVFAAGLVPSNSARALGPRDRHLTSARHGVSLEAPAGWALSQHSGYGDTVAVLLHPDGGRITVTASMTLAADARSLFEQNRPGLIAQKLIPAQPQPGPHGFLSVDISSPGRAERLRQLYVVRAVPRGRQGVILTLVCRDDLLAELTSALAFVVERLELDDPVLPSTPGDNLPRPPLSGNDGLAPPPPAPVPTSRARDGTATATTGVASTRAPDAGAPGGRDVTPAPPPGAKTSDDAAAAGGSGGQLRPGHRRGKTNTQDLQQR